MLFQPNQDIKEKYLLNMLTNQSRLRRICKTQNIYMLDHTWHSCWRCCGHLLSRAACRGPHPIACQMESLLTPLSALFGRSRANRASPPACQTGSAIMRSADQRNNSHSVAQRKQFTPHHPARDAPGAPPPPMLSRF